MPTPPDSLDPLAWHKHFAMQANNRAWSLTVAVRTPAEDVEMLDAAHAAAFHWSAVGTELNVMRAKMLLAEVHALVGFGASSFALSAEVLSYFKHSNALDWERAFAYVIHAHAAYAAGRAEDHADAYKRAVAVVDMIAEPEDRRLVLETFEHVPAP